MYIDQFMIAFQVHNFVTQRALFMHHYTTNPTELTPSMAAVERSVGLVVQEGTTSGIRLPVKKNVPIIPSAGHVMFQQVGDLRASSELQSSSIHFHVAKIRTEVGVNIIGIGILISASLYGLAMCLILFAPSSWLETENKTFCLCLPLPRCQLLYCNTVQVSLYGNGMFGTLWWPIY